MQLAMQRGQQTSMQGFKITSEYYSAKFYCGDKYDPTAPLNTNGGLLQQQRQGIHSLLLYFILHFLFIPFLTTWIVHAR
jgi:hypothetical protein